MNTHPLFTRRQFLAWASASTALVVAHPIFPFGERGSALSSDNAKETLQRILSLELLTSAPLARMKDFYCHLLGLPVVNEEPDRLTIAAGGSRLDFVKAESDDGKPFYHFAFNIPENKVLEAYNWQKERTPLLPIPERLRDPEYPEEVVHYRHWNSHSIFFLDPGGNVVEYIARHDLGNARPGDFGNGDILCASEIGLIVDDVPATASKLKEVFGLSQYQGGSDQFTALGDEHGLVLVMRRGRILNFNRSSDEKAARVFRTKVGLRGDEPMKYLFPNFPYQVSAGG